MSAYPGFVGGFEMAPNPVSDTALAINFYVQRSDAPGATSPATLEPTPGYRAFAHVAQVGGRAMYALDRCFGVIGAKLYEFLADGTAIDRTGAVGLLAIDGLPATISSNGAGGNQLFITSGGNGYCYDLATDTLTLELTGTATMAGSLYGYFVAFDRTTGTIALSDLFDGTTWDPTQFAQNSVSADDWQTMLVTPYGHIALIGRWTGQFWYNSGAFPFPFALDPSGLMEQGTAATFSIKQAGNSVVWLSTTKNGGYQVQRATGFTPQRISKPAIEAAIAQYTRVDDAISETYEDQGHAFYLLTFPTALVTWVYDFTSDVWHQRSTWISEQMTDTYARASTAHCFAFNKHLVADRETGVIYEQDIRFPLDVDGRPIRRVRQAPALINENRRMSYPLFEVLLQAGLGTATGQGADPVVMMQKSNDAGQTWGNERSASAGRMGERNVRCRWLNTGQGRQRSFRITVTDPIVNWRITEAYLRAMPSTEAT